MRVELGQTYSRKNLSYVVWVLDCLFFFFLHIPFKMHDTGQSLPPQIVSALLFGSSTLWHHPVCSVLLCSLPPNPGLTAEPLGNPKCTKSCILCMVEISEMLHFIEDDEKMLSTIQHFLPFGQVLEF